MSPFPFLQKELIKLLDAHRGRVEAEAADFTAGAAAAEKALDRAATIHTDFNEGPFAQWAEKHPAAVKLLNEQAAIDQVVQEGVIHEPENVLRAARAAGLKPQDLPRARKVFSEARRRLERWNEKAQERQAGRGEGVDERTESLILETRGQMEIVLAARAAREALEGMLNPAQRAKFRAEILEILRTLSEPGGLDEGGRC